MIKMITGPISLLLLAVTTAQAQAGVVVIGHAGLGKLKTATIQRIYTGKIIEIDGISITPVNIHPGQLHDQFLHDFLNLDSDKYAAYWTVRRYIGKGVPPMVLNTAEEVKHFVQSTPGAIGYIDESQANEQLNVIAR